MDTTKYIGMDVHLLRSHVHQVLVCDPLQNFSLNTVSSDAEVYTGQNTNSGTPSPVLPPLSPMSRRPFLPSISVMRVTTLEISRATVPNPRLTLVLAGRVLQYQDRGYISLP